MFVSSDEIDNKISDKIWTARLNPAGAGSVLMLRITVLAACLAAASSFAPSPVLRRRAPLAAFSPALAPRLPVFSIRCDASAAAGGGELVLEPEEAAADAPKQSSELKKILPLGLMFFFLSLIHI